LVEAVTPLLQKFDRRPGARVISLLYEAIPTMPIASDGAAELGAVNGQQI